MSIKNWPNLSYRADIQGLRALAVLLVVLFHADVTFLKGGYIGVDVFFVISGYLISGLLFKELTTNHKIDFKRFYARRIRRILPLSVFVTLFTLLFFSFFLSPFEIKELSKTSLFTSLFSSNVWFAIQATDYFGVDTKTSPLLHTWSLGVEEQFYFIWPALLALLPLFSRSKVIWAWAVGIVTAVSLISFLYLFSENQPLTFFGMPTRAWQFGFGALIFFIPQYKHIKPIVLQGSALIGMGFILYASVAVSAGFNGNPWWAIFPTLGACLIIWSGQSDKVTVVGKVLSAKISVFVGTLSYSLYLWHWPVLVFLKLDELPKSVFVKPLALLVMLCLSYLTYRVIEAPFRSHSKLKSNVNTFLFGATLVVVGIGSSFAIYFYSKFALATLGQQKIESLRFANDIARECTTKISDVSVLDCALGDVHSETSIVVLGDSKAQQWLPVLSKLGLENGWKVIPMLKSGCAPVNLTIYLGYLGREYRECNEWRQAALGKIEIINPSLIFLTHFSDYSKSISGIRSKTNTEDWRQTYNDFKKMAIFDSTALFYLRDNPIFPVNVPTCLSRTAGSQSMSAEMCQFPRSRVNLNQNIFDVARSEFENMKNFTVLDLTEIYCPQGICYTYKSDVVRYFDNHHLSLDFTKQLAPRIEEEMLKQLQN